MLDGTSAHGRPRVRTRGERLHRGGQGAVVGVRTALAGLIALAMLAHATTAAAQQWSGGLSASTAAGYTDNVRSSEDTGDPVGDAFYRVRPSAQAYLLAPRGLVVLGYAVDLVVFQSSPTNNALTHAAVALAELETSERGELELEAQGLFGQSNNLLFQGRPESGSVDFVPPGENSFRSFEVSETFRWQATQRTRLLQSAGLRSFDTSLDGSRVSSVLGGQAGAGLEYSTETNTFDAGAIVRYLQLSAVDEASEDQSIVDAGGQVGWRRDLAPSWVAAARVGGLVATNSDAAFSDRVRVVGGAEIAYFPSWGGAALTYTRASDPNLFLGIISLTDSLTARAFLPLVGRQRQPATLTLAASAGRQWGRGLALDTGMRRGEWTTTLADASLVWAVNRSVQVSARYQFSDQNGDDVVLPDYRRNTATVELTASYGGPPARQPSVSELAERETAEEENPAQQVDPGGVPR